MKRSKKYNYNLDIIRILSCIAVLLYHLGYLKGGYLAVNIFFLLSGYLHIITIKKNKINPKEYYKNKLKKLYLPLIIVVFITIALTTINKNIYWLNIKNETTSVLLGYNNFWQINANQDYFTRQIDSPFTHLWYISILIQLELLFPLIYKILTKIQEKTTKKTPIIITTLLGIISTIYFIKLSQGPNLINAYYNTFARCHSFLYGITLGLIHKNYKPYIPSKLKKHSKLIYYIYIILFIILTITIDSNTQLFIPTMILINIIAARMIDYSTQVNYQSNKITTISKQTYIIYLIQYPIIYIFQYININNYLKIPLIIIIIILTTYLINKALNTKPNNKTQKILLSVIILITLFGTYKYITSKTYKKEIEELKQQLSQNEKIMTDLQNKYENQNKQQEEDWNKQLSKLENEDNYPELVKELNITFIGDSVMLGAMNNILKTFPNSYFDAKESRQIYTAQTIIKELKQKNKLGQAVVIHLGTNGDCSTCKEKIMNELTNKEVFWLNTTNDTKVNQSLKELETKYSNLTIIDWKELSTSHEDWFYYDGIHLPPKGRTEYTNIIYNEILNKYKVLFQEQKNQLIQEHKQELQNKPLIIGNDILLHIFDELNTNFPNSKLIIDKDLTYQKLKTYIEEELKEDTLSNQILIAIDNDIIISTKEYQELLDLISNKQIYILSTNKPLDTLTTNKNTKIIDFYKELKKHKDYLLKDKIHLTEKGNQALIKILNSQDIDNK